MVGGGGGGGGYGRGGGSRKECGLREESRRYVRQREVILFK